MAQDAADLRQTLVFFAARPVESFRGPWADTGESFRDPDVALDFVRHLDPRYGPTLVRATVRGAELRERMALDGDWLCEGGGQNRLVPSARWVFREEPLHPWNTDGRHLVDAWERCEDGRALLQAAGVARVDLRLLVRAAAACARAVLRFVPAGEARPLRAVEVAEAWARGEASAEEVAEAHAAVGEIIDAEWVGARGDHATYAAYAAIDGATGHDVLVRHAAESAYHAIEGYHGRTTDMAALVRAQVPTLAVLRGAASLR